MQIQVPDNTKHLSVAAGFADVDQFVFSLHARERERLAIQAGIEAMESGDVTEFAEFDRDFREQNGLNRK